MELETKSIKKQIHNSNHEKGAGMTEYVLLVSLVGIALIGAINLLQQNINSSFSNSTSALAN